MAKKLVLVSLRKRDRQSVSIIIYDFIIILQRIIFSLLIGSKCINVITGFRVLPLSGMSSGFVGVVGCRVPFRVVKRVPL